MFQHQLPEQEAAVAPPARPGETITPTKLHALRRRQLLDLAVAFDIKLPPGQLTKAQLLPYMTAAESQGVFRRKPVSPYHLLHAQLSHDIKLPDHEREELVEQLSRAEWREFPPAEFKAKTADPDSYWGLQRRARKLGLNTAGKKADELKAMIAEAENESAGNASGAQS